MNWYYHDGTNPVGPFADSQVIELVKNGTIKRDTQMWKEGSPAWCQAATTELAHYFAPTPPPMASPSLMTAPPPKRKHGKVVAIVVAAFLLFFGLIAGLSSFDGSTEEAVGSTVGTGKDSADDSAGPLGELLSFVGNPEGKIKDMAVDSVQKFNGMVNEAKTREDAQSCIDFYTTMEMDFIKFNVKYDMDEPLARFYQGTSNSLAVLCDKFDIRPEYNAIDSVMKKLGED